MFSNEFLLMRKQHLQLGIVHVVTALGKSTGSIWIILKNIKKTLDYNLYRAEKKNIVSVINLCT